MDIPEWATHEIFWTDGKKEYGALIGEGWYKYTKGFGDREKEYKHHWGVENWKRAVGGGSFKLVKLEPIVFTLENE